MSSVMAASPPSAEPHLRRWNRSEFYRLAEAGLFVGQRVELIGGILMVQSPQNWPHTSTVDRAAEVLGRVFASGHWLRVQFPLALRDDAEPEPDVSVVTGKRDDYSDHPSTAVLILEVSDTTLAFDRGDKASLYPSADIQDYWVLNTRDGQLEVHRIPQPDSAQPFGHGYADITIYSRGQSVTPLAVPTATVAVDDLLP